MQLSEIQKKFLRGMGHKLKPVVTVGDAGISDSLFNEFDTTIGHHELIKVRVRAETRQDRDEIIGELCNRGSAILIARIGNIALLFRRNADRPHIPLPKE